MIVAIGWFLFSFEVMAADPKRRPPPKRAPTPVRKVAPPDPPAKPVQFWIETEVKGDSPPQTTVILRTSGGLTSTVTIGTYAGACSGRALEGKVLYSFDCFDAGLGEVIDFKHVGSQLIVQYSQQWEEGDAPAPRVLTKLDIPAGQSLTYGPPAQAQAAAPAPAAAPEPAATPEAAAAPPAPAPAPPSLKIVEKSGYGPFDAVYGSKKSTLNLWNDGAIQEAYCWAQTIPVFHGVRTSVQVSGLTSGTKIEAELWGTSKTYEDNQGYIECDTKSLSSLARVAIEAPTEASTQDIDILLGAPTKAWPCQMKVTVKATNAGKVLAEGDGSMGLSCPE